MGIDDRQTLEEIRQAINEILNRKRAEKTEESYKKAYERLLISNLTPSEYCHGSSKGVYYTIKASYQFALAYAVDKQFDIYFDRNSTKEKQSNALIKIKDLFMKLMESNPDYHKENRYKGIDRAFSPGRKKRSKRQILRYLPHNWRELVITGAASQHQIAIITLALTGCRPAELEKGIVVVKQNNGIEVFIEGAKITEHSGQKQRSILFDHQLNPFARILWEKLNHGQEIVVSANHWTLRDAIKVAAKRSGISKWKSITPYCFRHQFCADTKAENGPVPEAMGHAADRSASSYGTRAQAKGSSGIRDYSTTRPVKRSNDRGADQHSSTEPRS